VSHRIGGGQTDPPKDKKRLKGKKILYGRGMSGPLGGGKAYRAATSFLSTGEGGWGLFFDDWGGGGGKQDPFPPSCWGRPKVKKREGAKLRYHHSREKGSVSSPFRGGWERSLKGAALWDNWGGNWASGLARGARCDFFWKKKGRGLGESEKRFFEEEGEKTVNCLFDVEEKGIMF